VLPPLPKPFCWEWPGFLPLGKVAHNDQEISFPSLLRGKGADISMANKSKSIPILYWWIWPDSWFGVSTRCTAVALPAPLLNIASCLEAVVLFLTLFGILWTTKWPPEGPPCNLISTSLTVLRRKTSWLIFYRPSADPYWRSSMPFHTAWDLHCAQ
jgi:hypothetical protein